MNIFDDQLPNRERTAMIVCIVVVVVLYGVVALVFALLAATGRIALARGAFLVGGELETAGPIVFAGLAFISFVAGCALWKLKNWGRLAVLALAFFGVVQVTPAISSAVADGRLVAIAREGFQIIIRVVIIWYLLQQPVRDLFD